MGRRDNLKILTTAILVVLLLSSFIFAFIYRNEIYQKLQTIGKKETFDLEDREISKIPPPAIDETIPESKNTDIVTKLPDLPNLDDMEPRESGKRQVSVADSQKRQDEVAITTPALKEKIQKFEDSLDGKNSNSKEDLLEKDTKTLSPKEVETKKKVRPAPEGTSMRSETPVLKPKKTEIVSKKTSHSYKTSKVNKQRKTIAKQEKTNYTRMNPTNNSRYPSNLEARIQNVEKIQKTDSERYEKRFLEIEKRIKSLEEALAK